MTKKAIKEALKNNGVKGWSRATVTSAGWVLVGGLAGKIEGSVLELKSIDMSNHATMYSIAL